MCGIVGYLGRPGSDEALTRQVNLMSDTIQLRGPDSSGSWVDGKAGIAFGHRRLSILDLSPLGHQPMISSTGRYIISFNGEIYNFRDLRSRLEALGATFKGSSDTEVFLAGLEHWGLKKSLEESVGMFACAIWDRKENRLALARDRLGEKPLYYGRVGSTFVFGSELKALAQHADWDVEIDREAVALFLRHNYVPHPRSIYKNIWKLPPGTFMELNFEEAQKPLKPTAYWSASEAVEKARRNPFLGSPAEAVKELENALSRSVQSQMISDVPLGAFLSGGVDSSTIVSLMQSLSSKRIKTFTIGFTEKSYDEAGFARDVAKHLGTDHHELYVSPQEAMEVIPHLSEIYDEPFSDSSQVPTYLVSKLARSSVTVSLSGDAGDELFGGYTRYQYAEKIAGWIEKAPKFARRSSAHLIRRFSEDFWEAALAWIPFGRGLSHRGEKIHKLAGLMSVRSNMELYGQLISHMSDPDRLVLGLGNRYEKIEERSIPECLSNFTEKMMYLDLTNYLPDDILTKVDRASMAVSLESRVPLLDHRVVELSWRFPLSLKIRDGQSKWLLRQILYKRVPRELIERPKMGFGVPVTEWVKGPLRGWAESLINPKALEQTGLLNVDRALDFWREHLSGHGGRGYIVWNILMLQDWALRWRSKTADLVTERRRAL